MYNDTHFTRATSAACTVWALLRDPTIPRQSVGRFRVQTPRFSQIHNILKDPGSPRGEQNELVAPLSIETLFLLFFFYLMILSTYTCDFIWPQHNRNALLFFFPFSPSLHLHARMCNNTENWFLPLYYLWITCIPSLLANKEIGNLSSFASGYPYDTLFLYLL